MMSLQRMPRPGASLRRCPLRLKVELLEARLAAGSVFGLEGLSLLGPNALMRTGTGSPLVLTSASEDQPQAPGTVSFEEAGGDVWEPLMRASFMPASQYGSIQPLERPLSESTTNFSAEISLTDSIPSNIPGMGRPATDGITTKVDYLGTGSLQALRAVSLAAVAQTGPFPADDLATNQANPLGLESLASRRFVHAATGSHHTPIVRPHVSNQAEGDLTVTNIEVTQAIQTLRNSVPLVAGKSTMVRVYLGTGQPVDGVDGILQVFQDGVELDGSPFTSDNGPITAQATPNRGRLDDTLNFTLPPLAGTVDFVATVGNSSFELDGFNFACRQGPSIFYVPTDYRPSGGGENLPDPDLIAPGNGDRNVRAIYPFPDLDYRQIGSGSLLWTQDINSSTGAYFSRLSQLRQMSRPVPNFVYGWLPGNPFRGNGSTSSGQRVAFGNTQLSRYLHTFAHELGHLFGMGHNSRRIGEVGIDVDDLLGLGKIKSPNLLDIMAAGRLTNQTWIDAISYNTVYNSSVLRCSSAPSQDPSIDQLIVTGVVDQGGVKFNPVFQVAGPTTELTASDPHGKYEFQIVNKQGALQQSIRFNVDFADGARSAGFTLVIPADSSIGSIRVAQDGTVLAALDRNAHAPQGRFVPPVTELKGSNNVVRWDASEVGHAPLSYSLLYSPDAGRTVIPLAVDVASTQFTIDANRLPASAHGRLLLEISDGLNTTDVYQRVSVQHLL